MPTANKPLLILAAFFALTARLFAYPTFEISTFDADRGGWEPDWGVTSGYLSLDVDGEGEKGKMITFNPTPSWTGDYLAAQVTGIILDIANLSDTDDVHLRIALGNRASPQQTGGTWFLNRTPVVIPADTPWTQVYLPLLEPDLQRVGNLSGELGTDTYAATFSDIRTIRILSAIIPLGAIGDEFVGEVRLDNIQLVPEPSTWMLIGAGLIGLVLTRRLQLSRNGPCSGLTRGHK